MKTQEKLLQNGERNYCNLLHHGNRAQLEKLTENHHKSGFDDLDIEYLYECLEEEMAELWSVIEDQLLDETRREAADVANYAHMIILQCDKRLEGLSKLPPDAREGV